MLYKTLGLETLHRKKFTIKKIWERTYVFTFQNHYGPGRAARSVRASYTPRPWVPPLV